MSKEMHLLGGELDVSPGVCLELRVHTLQMVVVGRKMRKMIHSKVSEK